jgi:hypothetical protein
METLKEIEYNILLYSSFILACYSLLKILSIIGNIKVKGKK